MLTTDLIRAQLRKGVVHPRWIDPESPALRADAAELTARFTAHVGRTAGELDEAIADFAALRPDVILVRGLAKLLWDRARTGADELRAATTGEPVTPAAIRRAVFRHAGQRWPVRPAAAAGFTARAEVIAAAAAELDLSPDAIETGLFSDLAAAQRILAFDPPAPEALLGTYNLALAQACLLRARELEADVADADPKRARALLRALKFHRLLFVAEPRPHGYHLTLDGPLSLFKQTSRYGLQLALFLPALVRCERWSLSAQLAWSRGAARDRPAELHLDDTAPLVAQGRDTGTWSSAEEEHFIRSFESTNTPWRLAPAARVIDLDGRDTLVPDFVLTHPDGREALLDLVFAWRRRTFERRAALIAAHGPPNLVIALAARGDLDEAPVAGDDATTAERLAIYRFKGVISPKRVLELAERVALTPRT